MVPKNKAQMDIPLCSMILMLFVRPTFQIDVLNMEQVFKISYREGYKVFYISPFNQKGQEKFQKQHIFSWSRHWMFKNEGFETFLLVDFDLKSLSKRMYFVWDGNYSLQVSFLILTIYMIMSLLGISLLIPLSLIPLMGLLNSSLP